MLFVFEGFDSLGLLKLLSSKIPHQEGCSGQSSINDQEKKVEGAYTPLQKGRATIFFEGALPQVQRQARQELLPIQQNLSPNNSFRVTSNNEINCFRNLPLLVCEISMQTAMNPDDIAADTKHNEKCNELVFNYKKN